MTTRICLLLCAAASFLSTASVAPAAEKTAAPVADEIFQGDKIWQIDLVLSPEEYKAMQPPPGGGFGAPPPVAPAPVPPDKNGNPREVHRNFFGMQFPWAEGALTIGDKSIGSAGVRYAGEGSYMAAASSLKRSFRIELTRFAKAKEPGGVKSLNLHCGALDPTQGREWLALEFCKEAGVVAPRVAVAQVTLTVPGQFDKELLGLYTLVEEVDGAFVKSRFGDAGLLMKPSRMQGLAHFGDDWTRYRATYQPASEATPAQAKRVIEFARLINEAGDDEFRKEIGLQLDVDRFLKYLAANALLANLNSFMSLGNNYYLVLTEEGKFVFIPDEMELALANFMFMGSAEELMKLSLTHPYPNESKLVERLLADPKVAAEYDRVLNELVEGPFERERLLARIEAFEKQTQDLLAKEAAAAKERAARAPAAGPGPGAGIFGNPPDLRTFVERRTGSVEAQLAGVSEGFIPQFNFGPPAGGAGGPGRPTDDRPVSDETISDLVQAPEGFKVTLFAAPPEVNYPVAVAAGPGGEIFVAVDQQGSLGRTPGGGKIMRCIDRDGDGKAEQINEFARMEHPRGVIAQSDAVWVLHPPLLSVFHDDDGDGKSDRQDVLVTGLTTELIDTRGGDHTTNGIRLGLDGWIYIAAGDYGIKEAKGTDGAVISSRGGCIARVRPDGTELEIFASGFRNPFDIAIDPQLNLFTRDNTNDGGGWDVRVSHIVDGGHYGYTQLYANFADEIMPALGSFGGGGGTGALYIDHPSWPAAYNQTLYTGDWGRSEVYRHRLTPSGASFEAETDVFLTLPRATGMDIDASGRLIAASWRGGDASVFVGPNVGFLASVTPDGWRPEKPTDYSGLPLAELVERLSAPSSPVRLFAQREILRRGASAEARRALSALATSAEAPIHGRVAAIFAIKQLDGTGSHGFLQKLSGDASVREFALRALADRKTQLEGVTAAAFVEALADESPRVQAQAIMGLVRLGDASAAERIVPLTSRPAGSAAPTQTPVQNQPDALRAAPHLATRALVKLGAIDACLAAIDGPHAEGVLRALRSMHEPAAVEGLIKRLATTYSPELRRELLTTLIRLYYREADYDGSWWGIRPDNTGPYYDRKEWSASPRIGGVIANAYREADAETAQFLRGQLARHQVYFKGLPTKAELAAARPAEQEKPITIVKADPKSPNQIGNLGYESAAEKALAHSASAEGGKELYGSVSCRACHTEADGQTPKGPHLVDIGKRYKPAELVESILKPSAKIAQGFESYAFQLSDGRVFTGFVVRESASAVLIRDIQGVQREFEKEEIEERLRQTQSSMPEGIADALTPEQLADLVAYLQTL